MRLADLTFDQRAAVEQIAAEYHPAYDAVCEKMKTMVEPRGSPAYFHNEATVQQQMGDWQRRGDRQVVLFDRYELNVRAWRRLKRVLNAEQSQAIGFAAMPPVAPDKNEDFGW
jgi:hypothetical protein